MPNDCHIGIDWGTHSSKLCIHYGLRCIAAPIFSSDIVSTRGRIVFGPEEHPKQDQIVRGLKGDLIKNSLTEQFWGNQSRPDTGTSLGEAVALSLTCLVAEAKRLLTVAGAGSAFADAELGFSFPNSLAEDGRRARMAARNFCEAAQVAVAVVSASRAGESPLPGIRYSTTEWKLRVNSTRLRLAANPPAPITLDTANSYRLVPPQAGPAWRFIVESSAAGIPYLRAMQLSTARGVRGLGKLLVIDIGAGWTDVGYMLRTTNIATGASAFCYLRPASAFPIAGNELTEGLLKHFRALNRRMSFAEAEAQKTSGTSWCNLPFVSAWMKQMCDHVETYVRGIPDERWLPAAGPLSIVVTGGSGLIPGLKEKLVESVRSAMRARHFESQKCDAVIAVSRYEPRFGFKTEADVARRAVSFGAADRDKPGFRYVDKFDPPILRLTVAAKQGWV